MDKKPALLAGGGLSLLALGAAAFAIGTSATAAPQAVVDGRIAVFKSAPLSAADFARSPFAGETGKSLSELVGTPLDPSSARLTGTASTAPWVVRSTDTTKVCLVAQAPTGKPFGFVCDNTGGGKINPAGLFGTTLPAPGDADQRILVTAAFPDDVSSVTLRGANQEKVVAVTGNAIGIKVPFTPSSANIARGSSISTISLEGAR